jgi:hypothetical protein
MHSWTAATLWTACVSYSAGASTSTTLGEPCAFSRPRYMAGSVAFITPHDTVIDAWSIPNDAAAPVSGDDLRWSSFSLAKHLPLAPQLKAVGKGAAVLPVAAVASGHAGLPAWCPCTVFHAPAPAIASCCRGQPKSRSQAPWPLPAVLPASRTLAGSLESTRTCATRDAAFGIRGAVMQDAP